VKQEACQRAAGSEFCLDARAKEIQSSRVAPARRKVPNRNILTRPPRRTLTSDEARKLAGDGLGRRSASLFSSARRQRSLTNSIPRAADSAVLEAPWPPVKSYTENPTCWPSRFPSSFSPKIQLILKVESMAW
jgi:hypothetical protein